jgi:hypothetical protein
MGGGKVHSLFVFFAYCATDPLYSYSIKNVGL